MTKPVTLKTVEAWLAVSDDKTQAAPTREIAQLLEDRRKLVKAIRLAKNLSLFPDDAKALLRELGELK